MESSPGTEDTGRRGLRALMGSRAFVRLWAIGALGNAMRFSDTLAAALFTWEVTGSGFAVAVVSAMRALPMLLFGAVAGVVSDAVNRKAILQWGMVVSMLASAGVCGLALLGVLRPWHVGVAAFIGGSVWATEMSTRRRMCGEAAGVALMGRAVALDSLTNAMMRGIGPLVGGAVFAALGAAGAFAVSAVCFLVAALLVVGVAHVQATTRLTLGRVPRDLADGFAYARTDPTVRGVLLVTVVMNMFAFSYSALVAPLALGVFGVSQGVAGFLASAEALGSLLGGVVLAAVTPRGRPSALMVGGERGVPVERHGDDADAFVLAGVRGAGAGGDGGGAVREHADDAGADAGAAGGAEPADGADHGEHRVRAGGAVDDWGAGGAAGAAGGGAVLGGDGVGVAVGGGGLVAAGGGAAGVGRIFFF